MVQENVCMARADDCSDPRTSIHVVVQRPLARQVARDPGAVPQEDQAQLAQVGFKGQSASWRMRIHRSSCGMAVQHIDGLTPGRWTHQMTPHPMQYRGSLQGASIIATCAGKVWNRQHTENERHGYGVHDARRTESKQRAKSRWPVWHICHPVLIFCLMFLISDLI